MIVRIVKHTLFLALLLAAPLQAGEQIANRMSGVWHGVGVQVDDQNWPMEVVIAPDHAEVSYPSLKCGGNWDYLRANTRLLVAIENITYGSNECLDGGLLTVEEYGDGMLIYRWMDNNGRVVALTVLMRGTMRMENYDALLGLTLEAAGEGFIKGPDVRDISVGEQRT